MLKHDENRVLSRMGARELTPEESIKVAGNGGPGTALPCTNPNLTANDGECEGW